MNYRALLVFALAFPACSILPVLREMDARASAANKSSSTGLRAPLNDETVTEVYLDLLGREPTFRELRDHREQAQVRDWQADDLRLELRSTSEFRQLSPETVIRRAYRDLLGREPDAQGLRVYRRHMIDEGWTPGRIRQALRESEEYQFGQADRIIERAYDDLLERALDPVNRANYRRLILREGYTEEQVRSSIRESVEYRVTLPDTKTTRAYREILGREPDPRGLESYRKKVVDARWTVEDVKNDLRRSAEFRDRPVEEIVRRVYRDLLRRDADPSGLASWSKVMREKGWTEADLREQFRQSAEYRSRPR